MAKKKADQKKNFDIVEIAKKKRKLFLMEKVDQGKALSRSELRELKSFEQNNKGQITEGVVSTQLEVAQAFKRTERTVRQWVKEGMPMMDDGGYNLPEINLWLFKRSNSASEEGTNERLKWDVEHKEVKAKLARLEYDLRTEKILKKEDVERQWVEIALIFKQELGSLPTRIAPQLTGRNVKKIKELLTYKVNEIFDNLAVLAAKDDFAIKPDDVPKPKKVTKAKSAKRKNKKKK